MQKFTPIKQLALILFCFGFAQTLLAQNQIRCATDQRHEEALAGNPQYKQAYERTQAVLRELQVSNYKTVVTASGTEYHIPVVVHVMHTGASVGTAFNPTDAAIQGFIDNINQGLANLYDNPSISGTFNSVNIPIRFYLAKRNELASCSAATGINRVNMSGNATYVASGVGSPGITDQALMGVVHWNDLEYYNVYIVNKIDGVDGNCNPCTYTAGYAYFPVLGGSSTDGMVVLASQVSSTSNVFIHELGHAFNLKHPFAGGNSTTCPTNANCVTDNDEVCDTDPVRLDFTCNPAGNNPCTGTPWSSGTTQFNYMAYFGCNDRFTPMQSTRFQNALHTIRTSYKNTAAVDAPSASVPVNITSPTIVNPNNGFDLGPVYVGLNSIDYHSNGNTLEGAGNVHYVDHTCNQSTTLIKTTTYPLTVTTLANPHMVRVYIDYNNDGSFGTTAPELVLSSSTPGGNFNHTGNLVIPSSGVVLNTPLRMRVIGDYNTGTITGTSPIQYGQAEDYTVMIVNAPLPIIWRDFSVSLNTYQQSDLRWSSEMEINNDYYEVERSKDGIVFYSLAKVNGQGTSYLPSYYSFVDKNPFTGINYYRIKQVDIDRKVSYSKVEIVNNQFPTMDVLTYPNPTNDLLNIHIEHIRDQHITITLKDLNGRCLFSEQAHCKEGNYHKQINTSNLVKGVYILNVLMAGENKTLKIIKE